MRLPTSRAGRLLIGFWAVLLLAVLTLLVTLQILGPPASHRPRQAAAPARSSPATRLPAPPRAVMPPADAGLAPAPRSGAAVATSPAASAAATHEIPPPDPALLEPAAEAASAMLPRIAPDGRMARRLYAAAAPAVPSGMKRVALLLDGVGLSDTDSLDAIARLPPAVSLAVSPYAVEPGRILDAARRTGHELLLSLPMEPARAPADDEGGRSLSEQATHEENRTRLDWSLSRIQGYAGVTNAFVGMGGERVAQSQAFEAVAAELGRRGLFYLDATPQIPAPSGVPSVTADLRLDDPPAATTGETSGPTDGQTDGGAAGEHSLQALDTLALQQGSAIGIAGPVRPVTIELLSAWAKSLAAKGLVLVPVSSLLPSAAARPATRSPPTAPGVPHEPG